MRKLLLPLLLLLISPTYAAQVEITEIMYDLEGADKDREWIEVTFNEQINFSKWKFYEAETNHRLKLAKGTDLISLGDYAIIVRKEANFLVDNPSFTGNLFTSTFSLSNTGETLEIRNENKSTIFSVAYSS